MADISDWSTTAASNNATPPDGAPEGMAPSGVNDVIRELMAAVRRWYEDAQWVNLGLTHTRISSSSFSLTGDYTDIYEVGRRVKMTGSADGYGTISASSYSAPDTTVTLSTNTVPATLATVSVGIISATNSAVPATLTGSFTGTLTGCTTSPTATINWARVGNLVTLYFPAQLVGTSNSGAMSITGLPAALSPSTAVYAMLMNRVVDNSSTTSGAQIDIAASGTTLTFTRVFDYANQVIANGSFTASGLKGIAADAQFTYLIT